jgi:hypothetical protein
MKVSRLCLLHSVGDAEQFLDASPDLREWELATTHPAVEDFLAARGLRCVELSGFLDLEDQRRMKDGLLPGGFLHDRLESLLAGLDALAPDDAWRRLGLARPIPLLSGMYRYLLAHGLWGRLLFETAFTRLLAGRKLAEVAVFDSTAAVGFFTPREVVEHVLADKPSVLVRCILPDGRQRDKPLSIRPLPTPSHPQPEPSAPEVEAVRPFAGERQGTLLQFLPEYDLWPLLSPARSFDLIRWPLGSLPEAPGIGMEPLRARARAVNAEILAALEASPVADLLPGHQERLRQDLAANGEQRLTGLALLAVLIREGRVDALAWGNSPGADTSLSLWLGYGMASGLPVLGMQHGGNNGVQDCGYLSVLGEYAFCTHLFGYGYERRDLPPSLAPEVRSKIVPVGSTLSAPAALLQTYRPVPGRVVFPATNSYSLLRSARIAPAFLYQAQREILNALDQRPDLEVWVKPFLWSSTANFACREQLAAAKNLRVAGESFTRFMELMQPELLVVEYPSSPLFEGLPFDVDIFLLLDPLYPFSERAEGMLRRRAHVFASAGEMARAIAAYGREPLARLRSPEYHEHYIARPGSAERLLREAAALVRGAHREPTEGEVPCSSA